jgi:hypothetical protein
MYTIRSAAYKVDLILSKGTGIVEPFRMVPCKIIQFLNYTCKAFLLGIHAPLSLARFAQIPTDFHRPFSCKTLRGYNLTVLSRSPRVTEWQETLATSHQSRISHVPYGQGAQLDTMLRGIY